MKAVTIKLSDLARDVLARSVITADSVKLPGQLGRKLYVEIDKVFKTAGGKWNRGRGVHLFDCDPREVLGLAVQVGEVVDVKKSLQFFQTPPELAEHVVELVKPRYGETGLEPSAGRGAIASVLARYITVDCVEIHPPFAAELSASRLYRLVANEDFLQAVASSISTSYDVITMNPPFHNGADVEHILHAWRFLAPGGRLTAITSPAWEFRDGSKWDSFRLLLNAYCTYREDLPAGTFHDAGTEIKSKLIVLKN